MNRSIIIKVISVVLGISLVLLVGWQLRGIFSGTDPITKAEASELVKAQYEGEILSISKENDTFVIKIELDNDQYEVAVKEETGEISNLVRIAKDNDKKVEKLAEKEIRKIVKKNQNGDITKVEEKQEKGHPFYYATVQTGSEKTILKIDGTTGKITDKSTETIQDKEITPNSQVSAKKLTEQEAGNIAIQKVQGEIDDIELEEYEGISYYLVEIERPNEQEATVQINSISGEVITITWDE